MEITPESLKIKIKQQGEIIRTLKAKNAEQSVVDAEIAILLDLQKQQASLVGEESNTKGKNKFTLKTPKADALLKKPQGTRDYNEKEMAIREKIFSTIVSVFKKHGAVTIDTPVFELKEILAGKYGEDSKLIYDLEDQGGEKCSLRYDLTVPFARFLAMNGTQYPNIKRYQIAKVYRRDQPAMTKGRMREFYQCDFDVAGVFDPMIADSEVVKIMCECLTALDIGKYTVKINHRKILDGIFQVCGVPEERIRPISSAVDKLDKLPWEEVRREMTEDKGLDPDVADRIGGYVKLKGDRELLEELFQNQELTANKSAKSGLDDMALLFKYLEIFGVLDKISFDLSLARGLDYYTGIIYEAVTEQSGPPKLEDGIQVTRKSKKDSEDLDESTVGVGSIAAGGRYDNLVGMFASSKKGNIPCVGVSIGVERVFSILLQKAALEQVKANEVEVYVIAVADGLLDDRMKICAELWDADIKAEFTYKNKPKLQHQFSVCDREQIPFAVIIGRDELNRGEVRIKDMRSKEQGEGGGISVKRNEMNFSLLPPSTMDRIDMSLDEIIKTNKKKPKQGNKGNATGNNANTSNGNLNNNKNRTGPIRARSAGKNLTRQKANPYPKPKATIKPGNPNGVWRHDLFPTLLSGGQTRNPGQANGSLSIQQRLGTGKLASGSGVAGRLSIKGVAGGKQAEFSFKGEGGPATIIISNLAPGTSANDIKTAFMEFGDISTVDMKEDRFAKGAPAKAELTFESKASALAAINKYNTALVDGRVLKVQLKQPGGNINTGVASYRVKNKVNRPQVSTAAVP
ncbi:4455_t:CDS:10 [Acaulospora colombiana]|uniref:4455_t:CDS:1 n=1 Tax=Acaulospora colombiana TaxID=27376 RepID=A0ACA9KE39_9GLOM|nr:4455_t:CDS:10 [Acaulospora colombiana]